MSRAFRAAASLILLALALTPTRAQTSRVPSARLVPASALPIGAQVDSNVPMVWDRVDGSPTLFALASSGGVPGLLAGPDLSGLRPRRLNHRYAASGQRHLDGGGRRR